MKKCRECDQEKSLDEFYAGRLDCKVCVRRRLRERYHNDQEVREELKKKSYDRYHNDEEYRERTKELQRASKPWLQQESKDKHNAARRKRRAANKDNIPIEEKVKTRLSNGLRRFLRGERKEQPTLDTMGCSGEFFIKHLENSFDDKINWDTFATWDIDHIIPQTSFDHTDPLQVKLCWHYTNLRPLTRPDNIAKSDKLPAYLFYYYFLFR
jgi:hypothetical protein